MTLTLTHVSDGVDVALTATANLRRMSLYTAVALAFTKTMRYDRGACP
jgi:hypothetical protein